MNDNEINLIAAERTIEEDSSLMLMYLKTPQNLTVSGRIKEVFKSQIRHDPKALAEYERIKKQLEEEQDAANQEKA